MKFKAIIFDLDGTIVNTENSWRQATHELIEARGKRLSDKDKTELHQIFNGLELRRCCEIIKQRFNFDDHIDDIAHEKLTRAHELMQTELQFIEGFEQFHTTLQQRSMPNAIATNADDNTIELIKKSVQLDTYFGNHIYGISSVNYKYKPNPDIYLHAANQLGINPQECIAIEDSYHGIAAAKTAGMYCIGINSSNKLEYIEQSDYKVNNYTEIDFEKIVKGEL